jgi:hypothetical protein
MGTTDWREKIEQQAGGWRLEGKDRNRLGTTGWRERKGLLF